VSPTLLQARGLGRRFGARVALAPTDLAVDAGEALALVGPNGAGKSTLLALFAGSLEPSEGTVVVADGVRIGWVPQRPAHYGRLSPRENLALFAQLERAEPATVEALLEQFGLPSDGEPSSALSVGNRQRLNIAISLLGRPDVLLLDEPTASLDPGQRRRLWETVDQLRESGGAVVFATQNLDEVESHAGRVAALRAGELLFVGPPAVYEREFAEDVFA
jgi:ABC-type multidrug transport system ATPase subunit